MYKIIICLINTLLSLTGIGRGPDQRTKQNFDMIFGVNHFGHFLLTMLLLDRLKKYTPSRIVTVSSLAHSQVPHGDIDFKASSLNPSGIDYPGLSGYDRSKLANILFTKELARQLEGTGVTAISLHPGLVRTNIFQTTYENGSPLWRFILYSFASL